MSNMSKLLKNEKEFFKENLKIEKEKILLNKELKREEYLKIKNFLLEFNISWDKKERAFIGSELQIKKIKDFLFFNKKVLSRKDLHFYPTPIIVLNEIENKYLNFGDYKFKNFTLLEPSAGAGNILDYFRKNFKEENIYCVELDETNINILENKKYENIIKGDFLEININKKFDFIIMNPPFKRMEYINHIFKAYDLLKENGKLIAIIPHKIFNSSYSTLSKKEKDLYELITIFSSYYSFLNFPKNTFKSVNIETMAVCIEKGNLEENKRLIVYNFKISICSDGYYYDKLSMNLNKKNELKKIIEEYIEKSRRENKNIIPYPYDFIEDYIKAVKEYIES